jgi:TrmH family RNA methyltransferase
VVGTSAVGKRHLHHPLRRLEDGAKLIRRRLASGGGVALLFGSEKRGLTNDELSHCHWLMRVPTVDTNISMNLGQAVAVCLYELIRDAKLPRLSGKLPSATAAEVERITALLLETLDLSGFTNLRRVADSHERIRRLVRRLNLPARDAVIWQGIFRQIAWKLSHPGGSGETASPAKP